MSEEHHECIICYEPINTDGKRELSCKHVFHNKCIQQWTETGAKTCPCCRFDLHEYDFMSIDKLRELYQENFDNMIAIRNNITKATKAQHHIMIHMFNAMLDDQYRIGDKLERALSRC